MSAAASEIAIDVARCVARVSQSQRVTYTHRTPDVYDKISFKFRNENVDFRNAMPSIMVCHVCCHSFSPLNGGVL
jgi:hypothetical protein